MTLKMIMTEPIPSYVHLGPTCLLVLHEGQPMTCRKCDSRTHLAANCSFKRCYNCGCVGHINADCQGCGSLEHHLAQCDTSFFPDASGTDDAESIPETPTETTMAFDRLNSDSEGLITDLGANSDSEVTASPQDPPLTKLTEEQQTEEQLTEEQTEERTEQDLKEPEQPPSPEEDATQPDAQPVKNWYDTLSFRPGTYSCPKFSSPLPPFSIPPVDADVPPFSERSFQDD